ncbi:Replication factor C C-terminal domain-containing protein [[Candida] zeylanoides]
MDQSDNLPWVEKYRPTTLDDVYGQPEIVSTVRKFVHEGRLPHLLFYGPPGTGKTSTIIALAREIYGPNYKNMVLELNASDDRGIDVVRNQIKSFASTMQIFSRGFKLIILDEADAMTGVAQNSLRRIIEKYTKNTRFCILANYAHKLNPALLSRCTRFRFHPLARDAMRARMAAVVQAEHLRVAASAEDALLRLSGGDMRRILNVLQACHAATDAGSDIDEDMIYECVGAPRPADVARVLESVLQNDWIAAYRTLDHVRRAQGLALVDLVEGFVAQLAQYELSRAARTAILAALADIEYGISRGGNDKVQTSAIIGAIKGGMELQKA